MTRVCELGPLRLRTILADRMEQTIQDHRESPETLGFDRGRLVIVEALAEF